MPGDTWPMLGTPDASSKLGSDDDGADDALVAAYMALKALAIWPDFVTSPAASTRAGPVAITIGVQHPDL